MTAADDVIAQIEAVGGELALHGERVRCRLPEHATYLLEELRSHRNEVISALGQRRLVPTIPAGIRLVSWSLKPAPIVLDPYSTVTDTSLFARTTLHQLESSLATPKRWAGWTVLELVERLAKVGVLVEIEENSGSKV